MQQIIVSGVGGQGVLFVTRVLAETALSLGYSVLLSETHGMAQRGGNVISHLKIAERDSEPEEPGSVLAGPLVRPGRADVLLALHPDGVRAHSYFLKEGGKLFSNTPEPGSKLYLDADRIASELGSVISANLVLLGYAAGSGALFCLPDELRATIEKIGGKRLEQSIKALLAGAEEARRMFS